MLIIKVDKLNIEKALKTLKSKVIKTRQNEKLRDLKYYEKKSVKKRNEKSKAIHKQRLKITE